MKILVPVKRVIDPYAKVKPLPDGSALDTAGLKFDINPFDEIAVEESVRLKEQMPQIEIIVVSVGTADSDEQLRKALAMGADRAIRVDSSQIMDSPGIAAELEQVVLQEKPDLVIMGKQATDDDCNQVGQMLAARLGWPQATFAAHVWLGHDTIRVTRETDTGEEVLEMKLPAIVTTDLRLNEPRYIALPGIIKARNKPLEVMPISVGAHPKTRVIRLDSPPPREPGIRVPTVDVLLEELRKRGAL